MNKNYEELMDLIAHSCLSVRDKNRAQTLIDTLISEANDAGFEEGKKDFY